MTLDEFDLTPGEFTNVLEDVLYSTHIIVQSITHASGFVSVVVILMNGSTEVERYAREVLDYKFRLIHQYLRDHADQNVAIDFKFEFCKSILDL